MSAMRLPHAMVHPATRIQLVDHRRIRTFIAVKFARQFTTPGVCRATREKAGSPEPEKSRDRSTQKRQEPPADFGIGLLYCQANCQEIHDSTTTFILFVLNEGYFAPNVHPPPGAGRLAARQIASRICAMCPRSRVW